MGWGGLLQVPGALELLQLVPMHQGPGDLGGAFVVQGEGVAQRRFEEGLFEGDLNPAVDHMVDANRDEVVQECRVGLIIFEDTEEEISGGEDLDLMETFVRTHEVLAGLGTSPRT